MKAIDLNCDLGESFGAYTIGQDRALMEVITSASVACGFHAGDPTVMGRTVEAAQGQGVALGAHPGYPDLQGFGRREMKLSPEEVYADVLYQLGALKRGFRACLAVSGGFDLPEVMGSRSTCLSAGFGGYRGRALQKGDRLAFRSPQLWLHGLTERRLPEDYDPAQPVRVVLGPQADAFSEETLARFFSAEYRLGPKSDRMGARLEGPPLPLQPGKTANIISDGIAMGSIQVPNGQPILMLADRQTTGGYVKLGAVITADLPLAAQKRPGDTIRFQRCTVEEAQMLLRRLRRQLHHAAQALDDPARW